MIKNEKDEYATPQEAEARAAQIGCEGSHSHDDEGVTIYMPCATHDQYHEVTGKPETEKVSKSHWSGAFLPIVTND